LPKTVTRQRRACDFWTQALLRMSPAWVRFLVYNTGLVQYRWPTDSGSTESARLENRKLFKIFFKLLYLRFPPLQIRTCVFSRPPWTRCWSNQQLVIDYQRILIVSRVCVPPLIRILFRFSFSHNIQIFCAGYTLLESLALSCPGILFSVRRNTGPAVKIHCCGIALLKQRINLSSR